MTQLQNPKRLFPMILSEKLAATKDFYTKAGFSVVFDMPEYLQVAYGPEKLDLCFMQPHQGSAGQAYPRFAGRGVVVSIPTDSADEKCAELKAKGIEVFNELEDKPWGWRSFHVVDPNGVILDFFHVYKEPPKPQA